MNFNRLLILLAALSLLALAGCGGGGDDTTASAPVSTEETTTLNKDELLAQGDGICAEVNAAIGSADASETESGGATQGSDLYSGMVERLKALGTPDDTAGYTEFIDAADELDQAESDLSLAVERGDEEGIVEAEASASTALAAFQEAASDYGFEDCSEAPSAPVAPVGGVGAPSEEEVEAAPEEEVAPEEVAPEEVAPEEAAPETGGGTVGGGTGTGGEAETGGAGTGGGIGPG